MLPKFLDPRFGLAASVAADCDEEPGFRAACRVAAGEIARQSGYSLDEALAIVGIELPPVGDAEVDNALQSPDHGDAGEGEPSPIAEQGGVSAPPSGAPLDGLSGQIGAALKADPNRSDRNVAREFGSSPTTVGKVRSALGLVGAVRTVQRNGRPYEMAIGERS